LFFFWQSGAGQASGLRCPQVCRRYQRALWLKEVMNKKGNVRITQHWGAFVQPLLSWK